MIRAKKSLGQNFLMHARIAERIVLCAKLAPDATVLEIYGNRHAHARTLETSRKSSRGRGGWGSVREITN